MAGRQVSVICEHHSILQTIHDIGFTVLSTPDGHLPDLVIGWTDLDRLAIQPSFAFLGVASLARPYLQLPVSRAELETALSSNRPSETPEQHSSRTALGGFQLAVDQALGDHVSEWDRRARVAEIEFASRGYWPRWLLRRLEAAGELHADELLSQLQEVRRWAAEAVWLESSRRNGLAAASGESAALHTLHQVHESVAYGLPTTLGHLVQDIEATIQEAESPRYGGSGSAAQAEEIVKAAATLANHMSVLLASKPAGAAPDGADGRMLVEDVQSMITRLQQLAALFARAREGRTAE